MAQVGAIVPKGGHGCVNESPSSRLVEIDTQARTYEVNAYRFDIQLNDVTDDHQFPDFPVTVSQQSNYGRQRVGTLGPYSLEGVNRPVVKVVHEDIDELVYAIRAKRLDPAPFVFEKGP